MSRSDDPSQRSRPDRLSDISAPSQKQSAPNESAPKKSFFDRFRKKKDQQGSDSEQSNKPEPVKFTQLFVHASRIETIYMAIACIASAVHGALLPVFTILFGGVLDEFSPEDVPAEAIASGVAPTLTDEQLQRITVSVGGVAKWFLILGLVAFVASFLQVRFQMIVAQRICARLRRKYFESLMRQDFTWYDENDGGELTARVASDVNLIQAGIGDKVTSALQFTSTFVVGVIIAFVYGPLLTLVILSIAPLLILSGALFGKVAADSTGDQLGAYGAAGAVANEVIGLIRTVTAYNGQENEARRYEAEVQKAYKADVKKSIFTGFGLGITMFIVFCVYALAFTFGAGRVRGGHMSTGDVLTTFFSIFIACISIGQAAPSFEAFAVARGAAPRVYEIIDRESDIDPLNEEKGEIITQFKGDIAFRNINFNYKGRITDDLEDENTRKHVLDNFSLQVASGTTHALVGESGCGKSTTVRLIERFYDVQDGGVFLDGVDVRSLNVRWLRSQMGYVGQMPTLFACSIRENIALGAAMVATEDTETGKKILVRQEVTDEEIYKAAKQANAHDFIMKLPQQYETMLGERGALLSGGQKQRVCIARALVRNPKILILDESTAALDAQSERTVQEALEVAAAGRTTITIAHRLSTVRNADKISVISKGTVVEAGKHADLLKIEGGAYRALVEHQNIEGEKVKTIHDDSLARLESTDAAKIVKESVSKTVHGRLEGEAKDEEELPDIDKDVLRRAFVCNASEWYLIVLGMIGAAIAGSAFPVMAIVFSEVINELFVNNTPATVRRYALLFVAIGGGSFVGNVLQLTCLGISGERLTRQLRTRAFRALLKQEMGFFDRRENSLGALTTRLATEATLVNGITGGTLGSISFCVGSIVAGFLVAYLACWRVALVVTAVFPLMAVAGALQVKLMTGFDVGSEARYAEAGTIASEAVDNIDTVTSLGVQDVFMKRYNGELEGPIANGQRSATVAGFAFGVSEFLSQALWAVSFWVGSIFVRDRQCSFEGLMKGVTGLLFAGMMMGQISTYMPDISKAKIGATKIFRLLDRVSEIDPTIDSENKPRIVGKVKAEKAYFEYPTRPDVAVLRGFSVEVEQGKTLALVGASGCGKSTIVALLERFYDARTGSISLDEHAIPELDLKWMRMHLGFVSQEPDLFNCSVRGNISYGLDQSDGTPVTEGMIISAAKAANAHDFVMELPEGYDTVVGPRGNRLSGGQRQRVAIARAIVREPRLLLLDEATSALDAMSEHVVQEALDRAASQRTTIAIAHRLSTVRNADAIAVVGRGKIVECGTHEQLLRIENGEYANLVKNQLAGGDEGQ